MDKVTVFLTLRKLPEMCVCVCPFRSIHLAFENTQLLGSIKSQALARARRAKCSVSETLREVGVATSKLGQVGNPKMGGYVDQLFWWSKMVGNPKMGRSIGNWKQGRLVSCSPSPGDN